MTMASRRQERATLDAWSSPAHTLLYTTHTLYRIAWLVSLRKRVLEGSLDWLRRASRYCNILFLPLWRCRPYTSVTAHPRPSFSMCVRACEP